MNPWVILGFLMALAGVYEYGHHEGYKQKETEDALVIGQKNQEMSDAKEKADAALAQAKKSLADKNSQLVNAIRSGDKRLFVNVTTPSGCAASDNTETRAELDRSTSEALVSITGDGDQAIVELNACIDQYAKMREIVSNKKGAK
jgi:hypothetical protein